MSPSPTRTPALRRLAVSAVSVVLGLGALTVVGSLSATGSAIPAPTPEASCGKGARPETDIQGRVPQSDYASGRAKRGYRCNTKPIARFGSTGGFKVLRYTDRQGQTCAYYDSTLLFPQNFPFTAEAGLGVVVLDMDNPRRPRQTDQLTTPAMLTPHESLLLNRKRGMIAAVSGNAATYPGVLDVYDVRSDCRHPKLLSSSPAAGLGHESGWSHDGLTFYAASTFGQTLVAVDLTDATKPRPIFTQTGVNFHGMRLSRDGNVLYAANIGNPDGAITFSTGGLRILDVSEIQARKANPGVEVLADLVWPGHSIAQASEPFVKGKRKYLLETDEFANYRLDGGADQAEAPVGAARIIDVTNPRRPRIVSDLRLQVHQPGARRGDQRNDPGAASYVQGYAGHYCSVSRYRNPKLAGCSMIASGLRVFDIRRLRKPVEAAYFNQPDTGSNGEAPSGAYAMSEPAWDAKRRSVWYTDGNTGFYNVQLKNGVGKLLKR
ncbi:LVIVD repeat-containing protein [Nocardioides sp.]|uniref:LVIVD repeat-containing protein n=1 Tax=Nocardioides sp. TaxID=35761 RepID=UPI0035688652